MTFEHLIQINDLNRPDLGMLNRFQLWEGLILRARRPDKFLVGVEEFEILDQGPDYLKRWIQLPGVPVIDEVRFYPQTTIEYKTQPTDEMPSASLTMHIEEPEPDSIFVRFVYSTTSIEEKGDAMEYDSYLQEAYIATDIETIQIIRELAATGVF